MRAVEFGWLFEPDRQMSIECMVPWTGGEPNICDLIKQDRKRPFMFRFDNGQLVTYRRKNNSNG